VFHFKLVPAGREKLSECCCPPTPRPQKRRRGDAHDGFELIRELALFALVGVRGEACLLFTAELQGRGCLLFQLVLLLGEFGDIAGGEGGKREGEEEEG
jgi:hypothetical protein